MTALYVEGKVFDRGLGAVCMVTAHHTGQSAVPSMMKCTAEDGYAFFKVIIYEEETRCKRFQK